MTPRFASIAGSLPKYRDHHRKLLSCSDDARARATSFAREATTTTLPAQFYLGNRRQKSSSVPLLPENGRYRLSMKSDRSRHRPIGETLRMSVVQGGPRNTSSL